MVSGGKSVLTQEVSLGAPELQAGRCFQWETISPPPACKPGQRLCPHPITQGPGPSWGWKIKGS